MSNNLPSVEKIQSASEMLKAIAHPIRLTIVELIVENGRLCVTDIHEKVGIEQAVASQHLKILKDKNVLEFDRDGKQCFYYLKFQALKKLVKCLHECQDCE